MAAAYAALVSLLNTLDHIQIHPFLSTYFNNYPNQFLRENIDLLVDFVENYSDTDSHEEGEDLLRRIAVVAHEAEDIIEVRAADRVRAADASTREGKLRMLKKIIVHRSRAATSTQQSHTFWLNLQRIIDDMDSIKKQIFKIPPASSLSANPATAMVENNSEAEDLVRPMAVVALEADEETGSINQRPASSSLSSAKTTNMVGFDGYLEQLLDQLTQQTSHRKILPIVGMGGIGKTTLARNVYDNLLIVDHFYVRAWVTVSQEFNVSEILLQALSCLGRSTSKIDRTYGKLGEELHKILYGRRYLIVLDDVWSVEAWDQMKSFFPENNNGSRIVITTRQT